MTNDVTPETGTSRRRTGRLAAGAGLLAAGAIAGGVLAGTLSASADTTPTPSSTSSSPAQGNSDTQAPSGQSGRRGPGGAHHGSSPVRDDEKALSTADAAKVTAAALKAVPGGTVYRVETDAGDGEYEAHMTKADGTEVTVKLGSDFAVTKVEDGMGMGDPAPQGAPNGQAPNGQAPNGSATTSSGSSPAA
jgi:hypothetical protein